MTIKKEMGADKLDRSKLRRVEELPPMEETSIRSILILALLVIVVAVGGVYFVKKYQETNLEPEPTPTPEVTITVEPTKPPVVTEVKLSSVPKSDSGIKLPTDFKVEDMAIEDSSNTGAYTLRTIEGYPIENYYIFSFVFQPELGDSAMKLPNLSVNYRETLGEIELSFSNVKEDKTGAVLGEVFDIGGQMTVESLIKSMKSVDSNLIYKIKLGAEVKYSVVKEDSKYLVFVENNAEVSTNEDEEGKESDATPTPTPTKATGSKSYDIESKAVGNVAGIKGHSYEDSLTSFKYTLKLSNAQIPNVSSQIKTEDGVSYLYVNIENLSFDGIASNDEYGEIDFASKGVRNIKKMSSSYKNGMSEYIFELGKSTTYKVYLNEKDYDENRVVIEFIH